MKVFQYLAFLVHKAQQGADQGLLYQTIKEYLPSGSGIDNGITVDLDYSHVSFDGKRQKVVLNFAYHHMNDHGMYVKWTDHSLYITPCLMTDFRLRITGENYRDIKDYLHDLFHHALTQEIEQ